MSAYSKAAKRRVKRGYRALCKEQHEREEVVIQVVEPDDPQKTVREARARQLGKPESEVMLEMLCEDAGRAIHEGARNKKEAARLWELFDRFDKAHRASVYHSTGRRREIAVSKMEFMPERFEVRHDLPPLDLRTEEERHEAAMKRWVECKHLLGFLSPREQYAIMGALWGNVTLFQTDRKETVKMVEDEGGNERAQYVVSGGITVHGQTFVASMRVLSDVVDTYENRR